MRYTSILLIFVGLIFPQSIDAQEIRSYDGFGNNVANPELGAAGMPLRQHMAPVYEDDIAAPTGTDRANPRMISNTLFDQSEKIDDDRNLSDFVWVFAQFLDHDITLVENSHSELAMIRVPAGDPLFDPMGSGQVMIPMLRSLPAPGTGTDMNNPRRFTNEITAFVDASNVYGSSELRADWLRSFVDGKMKVSEDNLLPFNTVDGTFNSSIDIDAPFMADDVGAAERLYVAGDVRANENLLLSAMHTIFVREHNRLCDEFKARFPSWSDEQLYQHARRYVSGMIQQITFEEWLPAMGVHLPEYQGYNPDLDPGMSNIFSAAAFRMGHTLLNGDLMRLDKEGNEIGQGNIALRDAFFNPIELLTGGGVDPLFQGMAFQVQQKMDCKVVDDVRNFLFGAPGAGGLDLAAININRGRERGLPDYNSIRAGFGLPRVTSFDQISADADAMQLMESTYGSVDKIDAWVGMLAEDHMEDAMVGPTLMTIMMHQFSITRDGDRFYYEVDPGLSEADRAIISATKLSDIIMRNSGIDLMQEDVFVAEAPQQLLELEPTHLNILSYPNPFVEGIETSVYSDRSAAIQIEVIDGTGRLLYTMTDDVQVGTNTFTLDMNSQNWPAGIYTVLARINDRVASSKVIKIK